MEKTISRKLYKKLAHYLKNKDTKYVTNDIRVYTSYEINYVDTKSKNSAIYGRGKSYRRFNDKVYPIGVSSQKFYDKIYKTLTLEEAIDFLPRDINCYRFSLFYMDEYRVQYHNSVDTLKITTGKTLLEAIEKILEYLVDNNLLGKT